MANQGKITTIIFSPHEDDETLACGGTIIKKIRDGGNVYLIFMTNGCMSHKLVLNMPEHPTPEELGPIRRAEAGVVAGILGVPQENVFFLDFKDCALRGKIPDAIALVRKYLFMLNPDEIFIPHRHDMHQDHASTNIIVLSAVKKMRLDLDVYEYAVWPDSKRLRDIHKHPNSVEMDISHAVELKSRAIDAYKSQVSTLSPLQARPILRESFLSDFRKPTEHFLKYRVQRGKKTGPGMVASGRYLMQWCRERVLALSRFTRAG